MGRHQVHIKIAPQGSKGQRGQRSSHAKTKPDPMYQSYPELRIHRSASVTSEIPWHSRPVRRSPSARPVKQRRRRRTPSSTPENTTPPACWTGSLDRSTPLRRNVSSAPGNVHACLHSTPSSASGKNQEACSFRASLYRPITGFTWVPEDLDRHGYLTSPSCERVQRDNAECIPRPTPRVGSVNAQVLVPQPV